MSLCSRREEDCTGLFAGACNRLTSRSKSKKDQFGPFSLEPIVIAGGSRRTVPCSNHRTMLSENGPKNHQNDGYLIDSVERNCEFDCAFQWYAGNFAKYESDVNDRDGRIATSNLQIHLIFVRVAYWIICSILREANCSTCGTILKPAPPSPHPAQIPREQGRCQTALGASPLRGSSYADARRERRSRWTGLE